MTRTPQEKTTRIRCLPLPYSMFPSTLHTVSILSLHGSRDQERALVAVSTIFVHGMKTNVASVGTAREPTQPAKPHRVATAHNNTTHEQEQVSRKDKL